ncbi:MULTISPECIES: MBL fold metallo-hydrolase [Aeromicrobium]|uniref:MBL fold metallo-hydrolase n=1 Tax=Aeromicrobium TaxID=2040 RepID=UPI00257B3B55|nr:MULTISPECIES: MBL fold metallo-hydrolase [Aeromicrobium]
MGISEVGTGIVRIEQAGTNCYLVTRGEAPFFIDAGLPRTRELAEQALRDAGYGWGDVSDVILTHAHFDHLGFAAHAAKAGACVWAHVGDHRIAAHPYRYRPGRPRLLYPLLHPGSVPILARMVAAGALRVEGVESVESLHPCVEGLPAGLRVVTTPGHTDGHCVLELPDADAVFTGDALVTLDPYTGREGPRIVARAGTKDACWALKSLDRIAETGARTVLPGHGEPWLNGVDSAVASARAVGVA